MTKLHKSIKKCDKLHGYWCGYLQPAEIIRLFDGNVITANLKDDIEYAKECISKGKSNPRWFYFQPKGNFLELHRGLKRYKMN